MLDVLLQAGPVRPALGALVLNTISLGLLLALIIVFLGTWRKTRAPFTLGLVAFAAVLFLQNALRVGRVLGVARPGLDVLPEALEVVALAVLLYLATR